MRKSRKRNDRIKRIVAIVCAALVLMAFLASIILPPALAATQTEIDDAKDKTQQAKEDLDAAESEKEAVISEYNAIDKQISDTEYEISVVEAQIAQTESEIKLQEAALKEAEKEYDEYKELFKVRARTMYENTELDYLEILFSAESFGDFLSKIDIVSSIIKYDQNMLGLIQTKKDEIVAAKALLEETQKAQEENKTALESSKETLNDTLAEKELLISELAADVEKYKAVYEAAEAAEQALIRENQNAFTYSANPVTYSGGKFSWPVPSTQRITSYYGYRIHPVYKTKKFHSGIDIGAPYGVNIVAAADGTVTLATYNGGYGKCIIINHGSGITTLYGHNSSLLVSTGTKVTKGQVIAKAGSTGVSTGPHLHFEVRVNGATTDPLSYFK